MTENIKRNKRCGMDDKPRCWWANTSRAMQVYHDNEWNRLIDDNERFFEYLCIEIMQAGLSFETVMQKRAGMNEAFDNFNFRAVASYDKQKVRGLMKDARIIRNKMKIESIIYNAGVFCSITEEYGSFRKWFEKNRKNSLEENVKLFRSHFKFTGPEIVREFLESSGLLAKDHDRGCFMHR